MGEKAAAVFYGRKVGCAAFRDRTQGVMRTPPKSVVFGGEKRAVQVEGAVACCAFLWVKRLAYATKKRGFWRGA
jgi:hypothetical protein